MKKWVWIFLAALAAGCSDDDKTQGGGNGSNTQSTLSEDVMLDGLSVASLAYNSCSETQDIYFLTLGTDGEVLSGQGSGAYIRFKLCVARDTPPFGRYALGTTDAERVMTEGDDASRYCALENGAVTAKAPLCSGQLTLSKIPGKKPADTRYYIASRRATMPGSRIRFRAPVPVC